MRNQKHWLGGRRCWEIKRAQVRQFVEDREYLGLGDEAFPEVVRTLEEVFEGGSHSEAVLAWGIGSGKSFLASLAVCYMVHSLLCLRGPQRSLGMARGSEITILIMAPSARQARDVVFGGVVSLLKSSPWFAEHAAGTSYGAERIRFPKQVQVVSGNSSQTFALGYNLIGAVIDEAAWFPVVTAQRQERVEDIYHALRQRISSRLTGEGLLLVISSPRTVGDFLDRRLAAGANEPGTYVSRRASWEVRPARCYCGETFLHEGLSVPVEHRRDFELNPQRAMRDLAARPTLALSPYLTDPEVVRRAVAGEWAHPVDERGRLCQWFRPSNSQPRYVHVDLGLTRDACGVAMAYCEPVSRATDLPTVRVELMLRLEAPPGCQVELARPRELVLALRDRGFNIAQVSYDGWQSADSRQILERRGIATKLVSVDRTPEAYETLKELLLDGRVRLYPYEPFLQEAERLEVGPTGKVDHPRGGSKDVADAVAGAVTEAVRQWRRGEVRGRVV